MANTNPDVIAEIGRRVREERERQNLTQEQLAERSGVQVETISRTENGRLQAKVSTLAALAAGLGCRLGDLVDPGVDEHEGEELLLERWRRLGPESRELVLQLLERLRDT